MRKITQQIRDAFWNSETLTKGNTKTDGKAVWLHGNKIIERKGSELWATWAGWVTNTTSERLKGILDLYITTGSKNGQGFIYFKLLGGTYYPGDTEWVRISPPPE